MSKKIDPKVFKETRKNIASTYLNPPFWVYIRKLLISIDFAFENIPNIPNEKKRLKNRQKRKKKK